ncbi:MAG: glycoside hydrolase family 1 protein [Candidatus Doudnabacteria bacterium]
MQLKFPQGFLWGSATAAHQVEGNNINSDWWQWENSPQRISEIKKQNKNPEDYKSGIACDSYNRYEEDFDIAQSLNMNAQRISIEWARIEPFQGDFDEQQIEHYRKVLNAIKSRNMKTFVTLHHFTNPIWFSEIGGWKEQGNVIIFLRYAQKVLTELHELIDFVCVINEPNVYASNSYMRGYWPPQRTNFVLSQEVQKNMLQAHIKVFELCKISEWKLKVGTAHAFRFIQAKGALKIFEGVLKDFFYRSHLKKIEHFTDFYGVNYYSRMLFSFKAQFPFYEIETENETTDFGWEIFPDGLYEILKEIGLNKIPIFITENGIADSSDAKRKEFVSRHLAAVHKAIEKGINVQGYMYWSLLDNFEWAEGYTMKFGLVEIDRNNNLQRKLRPSAKYYSEVCKNNYLEMY